MSKGLKGKEFVKEVKVLATHVWDKELECFVKVEDPEINECLLKIEKLEDKVQRIEEGFIQLLQGFLESQGKGKK